MLKIKVFYRTEWTKGETRWRWILTIFKYQNECYKHLKSRWKNRQSGKSRWKNEVISLVFMLPSWVMVLKLYKKAHILQFCTDFSKEPKSVKAVYILHLKVLILWKCIPSPFGWIYVRYYKIIKLKISC